jgi:hypothetical protein
MNNISLTGFLSLLVSCVANASVIVTWSANDTGAASAWLNSIENSPSRVGATYYSITRGDPPFSGPLTANLTVWANRAELNIFGVGTPPGQFALAGIFPGLDPILLIQQEQLVSEGFGSYSYSSSFVVEEGFARVVAISEGLDGLWLRADSGGGSSSVYTFQASAVPEPSALVVLVLACGLLLQRRNTRFEQDANGNRRDVFL